jgi:AcrR family transcriptional regulator
MTEPTVRPRLTRRERRHQDTREEILAVARELLLEVGLEELTLRQVARRADFSPASLYTYFASRDDIVVALHVESLRRLNAYIRRVPPDLPPDRRVVELGVAYMDFAHENPVDARCILSSAQHGLPENTDPELGLEAVRLIGETFREGAETGVFAVSDQLTLAEMAYGVWAMVQGVVSIGAVDLGEAAGVLSVAPRRVLEAYVAGLKAPKGTPAGRSVADSEDSQPTGAEKTLRPTPDARPQR